MRKLEEFAEQCVEKMKGLGVEVDEFYLESPRELYPSLDFKDYVVLANANGNLRAHTDGFTAVYNNEGEFEGSYKNIETAVEKLKNI